MRYYTVRLCMEAPDTALAEDIKETLLQRLEPRDRDKDAYDMDVFDLSFLNDLKVSSTTAVKEAV